MATSRDTLSVGRHAIIRPASYDARFQMSITDDATTLLLRLVSLERDLPDTREQYIDGAKLAELVTIEPERLNDAVALLEENGYLEVLKTFGTQPFDFNSVRLLSRGRLEAERIRAESTDQITDRLMWSEAAHFRAWDFKSATQSGHITRFAQPVGSPYGFTVHDWEAVFWPINLTGLG